jgi:hypothetical protein
MGQTLKLGRATDSRPRWHGLIRFIEAIYRRYRGGPFLVKQGMSE